jgi:hypothetical protein
MLDLSKEACLMILPAKSKLIKYPKLLLVISLSLLVLLSVVGYNALVGGEKQDKPKSPPLSEQVPIEDLDQSFLPVYPGAQVFKPPASTREEDSSQAKYYRLSGGNKLEEIRSWYENWFKEAKYTVSQSMNLDGSWSIAANTDQETRVVVSGYFQNEFNVIKIK